MKILDFDLNNYDALIFDLDGTLINSMPLHNKAWMDTFKENGVTITQNFLMETAGMASTRIVSIVNKEHNVNLDPSSISKQKRLKYLSSLAQVEVVKPVIEIVEKFYHKIPMAIITGSSHEVVDQLLPLLGIHQYFCPIICSDDTTLGKDSTEPYELACKHLNVSAKKSLFFDDGDVGLKGARLAGMDIIHVDINHPEIFLSC